MVIESVRVRPEVPVDSWPFFLPPVRQMMTASLVFDKPVTFLVGENGSGKSTIVEAIATAYGLDVRGGHGARKYAVASQPPNPLAEMMVLDFSRLGLRLKSKRSPGFFLRSETALGVFEHMSDYGVAGYGVKHLGTVSHGEGYIQVISGRFNQKGLYLLDEPEAALSFASQLVLMEKLQQLVANGSQVICATHSPILASLPGATLYELNDAGIAETAWEKLSLVEHWRRYLANPSFYLRS